MDDERKRPQRPPAGKSKLPILASKRMEFIETPFRRNTFLGAIDCVLVNGIHPLADSSMPPFMIVTALLTRIRGHWMLHQVMVDDDDRRKGYATEFVEFYEDRIGELLACWASDSGVAFANRYIEAHGARPQWKVVSEQESLAFAAFVEGAKHGE